jgi:hypothetical protein
VYGTQPICDGKAAPSYRSTPGTPDPDGRFGVDVSPALSTGEWVCVLDFKNLPSGNPSKPMNVDAVPIYVTVWTSEESATPWGRTRLYLSAGVVLGQINGQFASQSLFLGLDVDNNWHASQNILLNTFFDAQLTSVPAAACAASTSATATSSGCSTASVNSFISSQKAGVVKAGVYAPMTLAAWRWSHEGSDQALFVAPIIEGGVETLTSTTQTTASATSSPGTISTLSGQNVYPFYSGGVRFGHFGLSHSSNISPYLFSFLDITIGQWQSFKQCVNSICSLNGTTQNPTNLVLPLMISLEGRLKVPKTPVVVGFDSYLPITHTGVHGDLRFLFGVRLDVGCLYNAFKGGNTPSIYKCSDDPTAASSTAPSPSETATPETKQSGK